MNSQTFSTALFALIIAGVMIGFSKIFFYWLGMLFWITVFCLIAKWIGLPIKE